jgi:hypothetical protein
MPYMAAYDTAPIFQQALAELITAYGNTYLVFDRDKNPLPQQFMGLIESTVFKDFTRRLLKTLDDVSYLQPDFFVANQNTPNKLLRVWDYDFKYIQNKPVHTLIFLTSVDDPIERIIKTIRTLEGD